MFDWNIEWAIVTGISSIVIASLAFFLTVYQTKQTNKHNRLTVKPHLQTWNTITKTTCSVFLLNNGLGPAFINSIDYYLDKKKLESKENEPVDVILGSIFNGYIEDPYTTARFASNNVIKAGDKVTLVEFCIKDNYPHDQYPIADIIGDRTDIVVKYKSIYEEDFTLDSRETGML